jgi:hypothetical protein
MNWLNQLKPWQRWGLIVGGGQLILFWVLFLILWSINRLNSDAGMVLVPFTLPSLLFVYFIFPIKFSFAGEDALTFMFYRVIDTGIYLTIGSAIGMLVGGVRHIKDRGT